MKIIMKFNISDEQRYALANYCQKTGKATRELCMGHILSCVDGGWQDITSEYLLDKKLELIDRILKRLSPNRKITESIIQQHHEPIAEWINAEKINTIKPGRISDLVKQYLTWIATPTSIEDYHEETI